jgi:hypothetical protein
MGGELSRRDAFPTAGAVIAEPPVAASATGSEVSTVPDLAGKTVVIQTRNRPLSNPVVLSECRFESQGGRLFLVGVRQPCARHLRSWTDGIRSCIVWECIEEYLVFDSLSDYHSRLTPSAADESVADGEGAYHGEPGAPADEPRE